MIDQNTTACLRIKDLMPEHHCRLIEDFANIGRATLAHARSIKLVSLGLQTEVEHMLRGQRVAHPNVLAVLKGFVFMARRGDPMKSELSEQGQQNIFNKLVLCGLVEE